MKRLIILLILINSYLFSQSTAGDKAIYESLYIVDYPTAGIQPKNYLNIDAEIFNNGGLLVSADYAIFNKFSFGISYGGDGIIGSDEVHFQNLPGFRLKFRPFNETIYTPAVALGFNSQGKGKYFLEQNRFEYLPPHFYLSLSKNFLWFPGNLAVHAGINYNFELKETNRDLNYFIGLEQSIGSYHAIVAEFIADNYNDPLTENQGYLNLSYRLSLHKGVTFELKMRDILQNNKLSNNYSRVLRIEIIRSI